MKKFMKISILLVLVVVFVGCSKQDDKKLKVGIIQISEHESLDETRKGIIDGLNEKGLIDKETININYQNAQGDQANLKTIASSMAKKEDIVIAIATPSAQAIMAETSELPIVFSVVTDPVNAGIVSNLEKPDGNITGTSDKVDIAKQIELLISTKKDMKTIGLISNSGEANSQIQINDAKKAIKANGLTFKEVNVSTTNDIKQATQSLCNQVDGIYVPNDNTVASGMVLVSELAIDNNIPVIAAAKEQVDNGALASYGIDHHKIGKETAYMAFEILQNKKQPKDIPVRSFNEYELYINKDTAKSIGIKPESINISK